MANLFRIVNIGDSVPWGQGLLEHQKYDVMIQQELKKKHAKVTLDRLAHSGAVIGFHTAKGGPAAGEVPVALPTIEKQCDRFAKSPETVDLVLVNGGINDVGVANILNPFALLPTLEARTESACHDRMLALLQKVSAKFTKPSCRILVTGYYTILSKLSDPLDAHRMLKTFGIVPSPFIKKEDLPNPVVNRCEEFARLSAKYLRQAVRESGDGRIRFVASGFTDKDAVFVHGTAKLWGLNRFLGPQDPVATTREPQCDMAFPDPLEFLHREQCERASAGHPNVRGAIQYKDKILRALARP